MIIKDYLSWILDKPHDSDIKGEEQYKRNIEFVHSLGLKCDCVGWSFVDLSRPDADEILDKIEEFCKKDEWLARGGCGRVFEDVDNPEWYELRFPDAAADSWRYVRDENGKYTDELTAKAYMQKSVTGFSLMYGFYVSENFRSACIKHNIKGVDFHWTRDIGRYHSVQYFRMCPEKSLPHIACSKELRYSDKLQCYYTDWDNRIFEYKHIKELYKPHGPGSVIHDNLKKLGGKLSRISEIFYDMNFNLPDYYPRSEMPDDGFVRVLWKKGGYYINDKLLVHKKTVEILKSENVPVEKYLIPVLLYDEVPEGYSVLETQPEKRPDAEFVDRINREYEEFLKLPPRPQRKATEKEAVKKLRKAKTERKSDFKKKLRKELTDAVEATAAAPLLPYYLVANGGFVSDEFELLPCEETEKATNEFFEELKKEELSELDISGIVFAKCADGDVVLLKDDGAVVRISHEAPEVLEEWNSIAQFFFDSIEYDE